MLVALTVLCGLLIVALVAVVWLLLRSQATERAEAAAQLQTMADRVQRPDRLPVAPRPSFVMPNPEPDESHLVGSISFEPRPDERG